MITNLIFPKIHISINLHYKNFFLFWFACFRPDVSFNIRLLKAVQLMEFPLLRQWITQMVNDYLKLGEDTFLLSYPLKREGSSLDQIKYSF